MTDKKCYQAKAKDLLKENARCIALGLSIYESTKVSQKNLSTVIGQIEAYPTLKNDFKVIASDQPFLSLLETNPNRFYRIFFKAGKDFRRTTINHPIPNSFIDKISKDKKFNKFVRYVVTDENLSSIQQSLFNVKNNNKLTHQTLFFLALNAIDYKKEALALSYLQKAHAKAYFQMDKDKTMFWMYLLTQNKIYLNDIAQSWDNNMYSLYVKELLDVKVDNAIYNIDILNTKTNFDVSDQFEWIKVLSDTKKNWSEEKLNKYTNLFSEPKTLPHYAYVLERYHRYKKQYFITPYRDIIGNYDISKQILLYSIGRQESRFIPSSVSFATAQGIMQIMPFLSKALAKQLKEPYNIYEQFIPAVNLRYASVHLDTLKRQFENNPLFIAYAYNGGPGYTRKQFKRGLFKKKNRFEPFMSIEKISYAETRKYGKKVLANYYIYNNYLNEKKVTFSSILQTLIQSKY